jgi:phosphatidylglycerophosphate synthase
MNLPNLISSFRIVAAPVMWILLYTGNKQAFIWLLTAAFFSDSIMASLPGNFTRFQNLEVSLTLTAIR